MKRMKEITAGPADAARFLFRGRGRGVDVGIPDGEGTEVTLAPDELGELDPALAKLLDQVYALALSKAGFEAE